jgi:diguanylate cyclase (GGDEF)-like protein/PAS domain S-box-containing protein
MPNDHNNGSHKNLNILVVQSQLSLGEQIKHALVSIGYTRVTLVESARSALKVLRAQPIDVLISDIDLSEIDGWRLSRLVRSGALRCKANVPIIVTTSTWCERIAEVTAREHGISALISVEELHTVPEVLENCLTQRFVLSKPRLLIVEDEEDTAALIQRILGQRFDIEITYDGENGLNAWLARRHDLVLLDIMLPNKLQGPDVLEGILNEKPNQPVVIMTAHGTSETAEELLIRGAADFIPKPFRPDPLRAVAEIALRRDDYMVSNRQFAERVRSLAEREAAYREVSEVHRHLLNNLQTVVMELDAEMNVIFLNDAWERAFGYDVEESLNSPFKRFLCSQDGRKYRAIEGRFKAVLSGEKENCEIEVALADVNQQERWVQLRISRFVVDDKEPTLTICLDDITKRKQVQEELEYQAMHDSLTGLYNRHYFEATLERLSVDAQRQENDHGLIYLDLDYFKVINDTFGHHWGDELLRSISKLISKRIRDTDVLCRFGGDEFALILHNLEIEKVAEIAEIIKESISDYDFQIGNHPIKLGCSIGISLIDGSAKDAEGYLMQADSALYVAKHRGRNNVHVYDPEDSESEELRQNVDWARRIRKAMTENRIVLHLQPIVDIAKREISYYEVLVRMQDVDGKLIMPGAFIEALESTGDMGLLDRWVIKRAISMLHDHPQLKNIAINLSAQAFRDENLVPIIRESLASAGISGSAITFELTESASLFNIKTTQRVIAELHELGCSFAVDDFGSGFSSFAYLKQLPADYIKLDGSFIRNLHKDKVDQALVRSIIEVVQSLGRKTVAEFVENEEILQFLAANGVDYAQGYHIGKPVPVENVFTAKFNVK